MCTVTYVPQKEGFILTSNRDEIPERSPSFISEDKAANIIYPKEPTAGGTWIAYSEQTKRLVCLLNGAFERHERFPPYRRSRGLVVLDAVKSKDAKTFVDEYQWKGIEPFTMIIGELGVLYELRWDAKDVHFKALDTDETHIWSSSPLYPKSIREKRELWFEQWLAENKERTIENIADFHQNGGDGDPENDLIMSRYEGFLKTISITSVACNHSGVKMIYRDLVKNNIDTKIVKNK